MADTSTWTVTFDTTMFGSGSAPSWWSTSGNPSVKIPFDHQIQVAPKNPLVFKFKAPVVSLAHCAVLTGAEEPAPGQDTTPAVFAGEDTTKGVLYQAREVITASASPSVRVALAGADHPLAGVDFSFIVKLERAYDPTLNTGKNKTRAAVLRHIDRILREQPGPFTYTDGRPVLTPDLVKEFWILEVSRRIQAIAKTIGNGRIVGRGSRRMTTADRQTWLTAWARGDLKTCFLLEQANGAVHPAHPGRFPETERVIWAPTVPGEVPCGQTVPGDWPSPKGTWDADTISTYLVEARCAHPEHLSFNEQHNWVTNHLNGYKMQVERLSQLAQRRAHRGHAPRTPSPKPINVVQEREWKVLHAQGLHPSHWGITALRRYIADHDLPRALFWDQQIDIVEPHYRQLCDAEQHIEAELQFHADPDQPTLTGYHRKTVLRDQHQRRWLFKPAPSDTTRFRAETEHQAHVLARHWGYRTAPSILGEFEGQYGQIQAMHEAHRSLLGTTGAAFADLTRQQLITIAKEHLLDWAIDNDDCHGDNIIITAAGAAVGIDTGRAWRYFGSWNGLYPDHRANTNAQLIYTDLYTAIADHHLDKATVDAMYCAVIVHARRMQRTPDAILADIIHRAVANRPHYRPSSYQTAIPDAPTNAEELITQACARKNHLADHMQQLWTRIYTAAGWEPPEETNPLPTNPQGHQLHAGWYSPELHDAIDQTKSYGTATFFAGEALEDGHILLWRERRTDGAFNYRGHAKLRTQALTSASVWCQEHGTGGSADILIPVGPPAYEAIIAAAKTVSFHSDDKAFNEDKMVNLTYAHASLYEEFNKAVPHAAAGCAFSATVVDMTSLYLHYIDQILAHQAAGTKSQEGDFPPRPHRYTPPPPEPGPVSVTRTHARRPSASSSDSPTFDADGELCLTGGYLGEGTPGHMHLISLPTGEHIEYRSHFDDTPLSQRGQLQFTIGPDIDLATGLQHINDHLTTMGIHLQPATPEDLELFYWRHLAGIMNTRCDARPVAFNRDKLHVADYATFWSRVDRDAPDEIAMWRHAFAAITGPDTVVATLREGRHLPHFNHTDLRQPGQPCGKPHWYRFDVPASAWAAATMPVILCRTGAGRILAAGAAMSTEERIRALAIWKPGLSSTDDMHRGSSAFVFARLPYHPDDNGYNVTLSPRVLARTSTYTFRGDQFGDITLRSAKAFFRFDRLLDVAGPHNEAMIKDAVSVLDDIEIITFRDSVRRNQAITKLASLGITEIRGIPVSERFLSRSDLNARAAVAKKIRAAYSQSP